MGRRQSLIAAAALLGRAPAAADAPALAVQAPGTLVGDGRSVAPIVVTGPQVERGKPLPMPEVALIRCTDAASLAGAAKLAPAVLAPVATRAAAVACVARLGDAEAGFRVAVQPPPPGVYATLGAYEARSSDREVELSPVVWERGATRAPAALQHAASEGRLHVRGGKLVLELTGNVPRMVAIALVDGEHVGAAFVPVTGVTTIPVEAERGATIRYWIAGRWFGPVVNTGKSVDVPVEVPPGITHGVVRSTDRKGYVSDAVTDLRLPARPRVAAVASAPAVTGGAQMVIAIAVTGHDGRPADGKQAISGKARRGTVGPAESLGGGLWRMRYTAPAVPGPDPVAIAVEGDASATTEVPIDVRAGRVARIELDVPPGPHEPGAELVAAARMFDAAGNAVTDEVPSATLGGAPVAATPGEAIGLRVRIPERLPPGELVLEVVAGPTRARAEVRAGGQPTSAEVRAIVDGRRARAALVVRDRFGNLVPDGTFEVAVTGGVLEGLARARTAFEATIAPEPTQSSAVVVVRAGGRVLASERVTFEPPPHAIVLGAWASGGWIDSGGALAAPRAAVGVGVRRGLFAAELALTAGVEAMRFRDTIMLPIGAAEREVASLAVPVLVRARFRITRLVGGALSAGVVPMRVSAQVVPDVQTGERRLETVLGVRAALHADVRLGPGRLFAGGSYGRARLSDGVVVGRIDGLALFAGYEWWFAAFGS